DAALLLGLDDRPDPVGPRRRDRHSDVADDALRQAAGELLPGVAAVGRLVDAALGAARLQRPGPSVDLPEAGIKHARIRRVHDEVARARLVRDEQDLVPALAAVFRAEDAALRVAAPHVALRRDVDEVRVLRMHAHAGDLVRVLQAHVDPGFAAVGRLVDAVAV